jgi:WD40 repeat protein
MKLSASSCTKAICSATGAALAGSTGGLLGTLLGPMLASVLPFGSGLAVAVLARLATRAIEQATTAVTSQLDPPEKQRINHDLQGAFRDAFREALYDLGGERCFPQAWRGGRDMPRELIYLQTPAMDKLWRQGDPLASQVRDCFQRLVAALDAGQLLPLEPGIDQPAADVRRYLDTETPGELADAFHEQAVRPALAGQELLLQEVPELETHLRRHLLDRTLVHLGEALKQRPKAWCAFNRMMLENLRGQVRDVASGQEEILAQLDALLARPEAEGVAGWADGMADLLTAMGQIQKQLDEGFEAVTQRVVAQHQEVVSRLDGLLVVTVRIETKVDRVLRILEDGRYIIEGKAAVPTDLPPEAGQPPYKGLQYFDEGDSDLFFGRELLTARLAGHLRQHNFLAVVVGASGSGKSSVVRAGLIPALRRGEPLADGALPPAGSTTWPVYVLTPTAHPLDALAASLTRDAGSVTAAATLAADLEADPRSLGLYARRLLASPRAGGSERLLVVVDQFEELFTLCADPDERKLFIDCLLNAVGCEAAAQSTGDGKKLNVALRPDCPTTVVITLRADFYQHCGQYANLREALEQSQAYIGPMDQDELRRAIDEPARLGKWGFERGLVDLMLRDAGDEPGALPLLSHALLETWKRRRGRVMTLESYAEAGGVRGAIAKTAEAVYTGLTQEEQAIARGIFLRLTELGEGTQDTRRRVELAELIPGPEQATAVQAVLKTLTDARLVTTDKDVASGVQTVEVAHEALIRAWPRLRGWLAEDRAGLRVHRGLTEAALAWQKLGREPGSLYRGARLVEAGEYAEAHGDILNPLEREYLTASQEAVAAEAAEREALRQRELQAARQLAEEQKQRAEAEAQRAEVETERAAEQARAAATLRRRALLLAGAFALAVLFLVAAVFAARTAISQKNLADERRAVAVAAQATAEAERGRADRERDAAMAAQAAAVAERGRADRERDTAKAAQTTAESERIRAETQAHLAFGRELATTSLSNLTTDPERSILLALHAVSETQAVTTTMLPEVEDALQRSVQTSRALLSLPLHRGEVYDVAYSPDGNRLVTASQDAARIWDATGGKLLLALSGHTDWVRAAVFSPDGQRAATASDDNTAIIWDPTSGKLLMRLDHPDKVRSLAFTPDGQRLVTACFDGAVRVWDLRTGKALLTLQHGGNVYAVALDPTGKRIASGNDQGDVRMWDATDGAQLTDLSAGRLPVNALEFTPDGQRLLAASASKARVWRLSAGSEPTEETTISEDTTIFSAALHPSGDYLATARSDGKVRVWDLTADDADRLLFELDGHTGGVEGIAFSPDGSQIATASYDHAIRVWNGALALSQADSRFDFTPDGRLLVIENGGRAALWDPNTAAESPAAGRSVFDFSGLDVSADGKIWAIVANNALTMTIWDEGLQRPRKIIPLQGRLRAVTLSPDGRHVLAADEAGSKAYVWDATTGAKQLTLSGHTDWIYDTAISSDSRLLATAGSDHTARVWDAQTGKELYLLDQPDAAQVEAIAFSPDGARLATAGSDGAVAIWDMQSGDRLGHFFAHTHAINDLAYSPDGRLLATVSDDKRLRIWDASSPDLPLLRTYTHQGEITDLAFSPDSSRVAVAVRGAQPPLSIYWLDRAALIAWAKARVTRALSAAECSEYLHSASCPAMPGLPSPPSALTDPLPYTADFSAPNCGGWGEYSDEDVQRQCQDGEYHITVIKDNLDTWGWARKYFTDFDLEVDATQVDGPDDNEYGVLLRGADRDNRYWFTISGDRNYRLRMEESGGYTDLIKWTYSNAIKGGNATNHLRVIASGDRFTFYVNGQELATISDKTFQGGDIGLIAGSFKDKGNVHVSFTNLTARPIE